MNRWLFKTEPSEYSFENLIEDGKTVWSGISNALALKHLRSAKKGDPVIVYHTADIKAAVGLAKISKGPYPDPDARDSRLVVVDIVPGAPLKNAVTLAAMRSNPALAGLDLLRISRLSVVPVSGAHWKVILEMAKGR